MLYIPATKFFKNNYQKACLLKSFFVSLSIRNLNNKGYG